MDSESGHDRESDEEEGKRDQRAASTRADNGDKEQPPP